MPTGILTDGDGRFSLGMDSFSDVSTLPAERYSYAVNMVNRGGVLQTRPGFRTKFKLPAGAFQGLSVFRPSRGLPQLVACVAGTIYVSDYPYKNFRAVTGASMSEHAKQVFMVNTVKLVERNPDNSLRLTAPQNLLILQDGVNPPAYYDGSTIQTSTGQYGIPQGGVMCWSGSRLWVARRERLYASDIADPLSFYEQTFNTLGGINLYILPGEITAMAETPGASGNLPQLLVFTSNTTTTFRSDIRDRTIWNSIQGFQQIVFPKLGSVSQRSVVMQAGMLWWHSLQGQVRLDTAQFSTVSARVDVMDNELIRSKSRLGVDLSGIASTTFDSFLLSSVPHGSRHNSHTWVLDSANIDLLTENDNMAWASIWTGVQPIEWASIDINGVSRLFCGSVDLDGENRVYEAFTSDRRDNGCDIPWALETRGYTAGVPNRKNFRYAELGLSELAGEVNLRASWAGVSRGRWKPCSTPVLKAREGSIDAADILEDGSVVYSLKKQSRLFRTQDIRDLPEDSLSSSGIEGPVQNTEVSKESLDKAFMLRIEGSGQCAIRAIQMFMDPEPPAETGQPVAVEEDDRFVRFDGAASHDTEDLDAALETYTSRKKFVARYKNYAGIADATIKSRISQADADKRAQQVATARADYKLETVVPKHSGGSKLDI